MKIDDKIINIPDEIAQAFNTYFSNIGPNLANSIADVLPLFKKGSRNAPEIYRPISILSDISKIMEKIMYEQLYKYLSANNILSEHQFGFRRLHSTASALLDSSNNWYVNMDLKMFLDLKIYK